MKYFNVERHDRIETWSYSNPPMNYMTAPMCRDLLECIGKAEGDVVDVAAPGGVRSYEIVTVRYE